MCCDSRSSPQVSTRATFSSSSKSGVRRAARSRVLSNPRPVTPASSMACGRLRAAFLLSGLLSAHGEACQRQATMWQQRRPPCPDVAPESLFKSVQTSIRRGTSNCWQRSWRLPLPNSHRQRVVTSKPT